MLLSGEERRAQSLQFFYAATWGLPVKFLRDSSPVEANLVPKSRGKLLRLRHEMWSFFFACGKGNNDLVESIHWSIQKSTYVEPTARKHTRNAPSEAGDGAECG